MHTQTHTHRRAYRVACEDAYRRNEAIRTFNLNAVPKNKTKKKHKIKYMHNHDTSSNNNNVRWQRTWSSAAWKSRHSLGWFCLCFLLSQLDARVQWERARQCSAHTDAQIDLVVCVYMYWCTYSLLRCALFIVFAKHRAVQLRMWCVCANYVWTRVYVCVCSNASSVSCSLLSYLLSLLNLALN